MARYEAHNLEMLAMDAGTTSPEIFVQLGIMYSTGTTVPTDRVRAHQWFNIAAVRGYRDAVRLRKELAEEMSEMEIACAQRAAREWLSTH